jgi:hypothetical protein
MYSWEQNKDQSDHAEPTVSRKNVSCAQGITRIKEYRMVFRAGLRDPCTRDVARLSGKRKNTRAAGECIFTLSRKSSNIPSACITLSCLENHLEIVL